MRFSFCTISRSKSEVNIEMAKPLRKDESGVLENKRPTAHAHSTQEATWGLDRARIGEIIIRRLSHFSARMGDRGPEVRVSSKQY